MTTQDVRAKEVPQSVWRVRGLTRDVTSLSREKVMLEARLPEVTARLEVAHERLQEVAIFWAAYLGQGEYWLNAEREWVAIRTMSSRYAGNALGVLRSKLPWVLEAFREAGYGDELLDLENALEARSQGRDSVVVALKDRLHQRSYARRQRESQGEVRRLIFTDFDWLD